MGNGTMNRKLSNIYIDLQLKAFDQCIRKAPKSYHPDSSSGSCVCKIHNAFYYWEVIFKVPGLYKDVLVEVYVVGGAVSRGFKFTVKMPRDVFPIIKF